MTYSSDKFPRDQFGDVNFRVGDDELDDLVEEIAELRQCFALLGGMWVAIRPIVLRTRARRDIREFWRATGKSELDFRKWIQINDRIAGLVVCAESMCLELCHGEWDFCKEHGARVKDDPPRADNDTDADCD